MIRMRCAAGALFLALACLAPPAGAVESGEAERKSYAVSVYGGALTDGDWRESVTGRANLVDSQILVGALAWTFLRAGDDRWSLELEANLARHFGDQDHWEFNLPVAAARWRRFPWSRALDTSLAFGMGPSYTTALPKAEEKINTSTEHLMLYWHIDLDLGLPGRQWAVLFRLHHRSTGYGLFGEDGGSNALTTGLRFFF